MPLKLLLALFGGLAFAAASASTLTLKPERLAQRCDSASPYVSDVPAGADQRLKQSLLVAGRHDIAFAWLAAPTTRYPHKSFGSAEHAGALHLLTRSADGSLMKRVYTLPLHRVFEDLVPRLVDMDGDGRDEVVLVESDLLRGAALVVLGLRDPTGTSPRDAKRGNRPAGEDIVELARGPYMGTPFRWLNPVGFGDFDGDGHLDLASVSTPHVGGELVLHHYRPPRLEPFARITDVSNHRMGSAEQQLGLVVPPVGAGQRASLLVPDMQRRMLMWLRWDSAGDWQELALSTALPASVDRLSAMPGSACLMLADASWWYVALPR